MLAIITVTYKAVLVVLGALVLIIQPATLMVHLDGAMTIIWIGMLLNIFFIGLLVLHIFKPKLIRQLAQWCVNALNKIRPFNDIDKLNRRIDRFCNQYEGTAEFFLTHKRVVASVFALTVAQRWALFVVTWFTYLAFSLSGESFGVVTTLQGMVSVAVDMLPLPGGMGASENIFLIVFEDIFGPSKVLAGMVVSRGISYYMQLVICGLMTLVASFVIKTPFKKN